MDLFKLLGASRDDAAEETADGAQAEVAIDTDAIGPDDVPVTATDENRALLEALREVIDPEIGINIVDLGLVYAVERRGECVDVVLTMTTPACPLSAVIEEDVRDALLERVAGVEQVCVAVIFEPPWSPEMMSDCARMQLGG